MELSTSFAFFSHFKSVLPLIFAKSKISSSLPRRGFDKCTMLFSSTTSASAFTTSTVFSAAEVSSIFFSSVAISYASIQFMPMFFLTCAKKSTPLTIAL